MLLNIQQAYAGDVPFDDGNPINSNFDGVESVYVADVDGDGDMDVLGAASVDNDIAWWENTAGDGSAWNRHDVNDNFVGAISVYAADIDRDGDIDVLGAASVADDITWWENTAGDGSAWTRHDVNDNFNGAQSVHAADIDSDGDLDVLGAASVGDEITWWENTAGDGSAWTRHDINDNFNGAISVYAADIDSDGDLDVLGAALTDDYITWWENTAGDGSAWTRHDINDNFNGARSIYAADIDRDGDLDVLGAAFEDGDITWWENTAGDGSAWTTHDVNDNFFRAISVYAADIDSDGDTDVLGTAFDDNDITWWENTAGDGSAWIRHDVNDNFNGAISVYAADIDSDGDLDVLGAAYWDDDITWWENKSIHRRATFCTRHDVNDNFDGAISVYAGDVDGDGDIDVLGAASHANDISWWENTAGDGTAWTEQTIDGDFVGVRCIYEADIDGDGDLDVLGAATDADSITWWENTAGDGSAWTRHDVINNFDGARSVHAADVDGDGDLDVLGAASYADDITWWENTTGDGTAWIRHDVNDNFDGAFSVCAADVDGDGDIDALGAAYNTDDIAWWENDGTPGDGGWTEHDVNGNFDAAYTVYAADLDGDGDIDALGAAKEADDITWWENTTGNGTAWAEHSVDADFDRPQSVYAADVDNDGDLDVLGAAFLADDITWWENTEGDGSAWTRHDVNDNFNGATSVYAADVDGDGDLDVLGAAAVDDSITWWENNFVIPGDFELDEDVDFADFAILALHWLDTSCSPCTCDGTDLTGEGNVNFLDLSEFCDNWLEDK